MKGSLLAIEGIDGAGKTVASRHVLDLLKRKGVDGLWTREPTGGPIGDVIRGSLTDFELHPYQRAMLFAADRYGHLHDEVLPAIENGTIVVTDRYLYSSLAYQGAEGVDMSFLRFINGFAPDADHVIFLDASPEITVARLGDKDRFEQVEFLEKVRSTFIDVMPRHTFTIDASQGLEDVRSEVEDYVLEKVLTG